MTTKPFSGNDERTIASRIDDTTLMELSKLIEDEECMKNLNSYSLVIAGTVGSGKSTVCESLVYMFNKLNKNQTIITFPEFLYTSDEVLSDKLLCGKLNGSISANTLQSFILDQWKKILKDNIDQQGFRIYERCVDDSVFCFCNMENQYKNISDIQLLGLFDELKQIDNEFNVPSYFIHNDSKFVKIDSGELNNTLKNVISIMRHDLTHNIKQRIIGLSVSFEVSKYRIKLRSRNGESCYTDQQIQNYINHYEKLFQLLINGDRIYRFVDLGKLL